MEVQQQELCAEINKRGPLFLDSEEWTDCTFLVGDEPRQVVVHGYKLIMAMASPVFEAMFYGSMAENKNPIPIIDVQPEIFKTMLQYMYTRSVHFNSCTEASQLCYIAKKYMLQHLVDECSNYLCNNVTLGNVCQLYEYSQLFEDKVLMQKCVTIFSEKTNEVLCGSSFKDAALSTVTRIFSLDELNINSEVDLINAAARYAKALESKAKDEICSSSTTHKEMLSIKSNSDKGVQNVDDDRLDPTAGPSNIITDSEETQPVRTAVKQIRFLTLAAAEYTECAARGALLTLAEDHAVLVNIVSNQSSVPMPSGFSTSRDKRIMVDKARSEATFRYTINNFSSLKGRALSPACYIRNLPWQILVMQKDAPSRENQHSKSLGFFVQCNNGSKSTSWSCFASAELRLISHKPGAEPLLRKCQNLNYSKEKDWGFSYFISWEDLLDPKQGYLKDDAITLEVHIKAEEPQGIL